MTKNKKRRLGRKKHRPYRWKESSRSSWSAGCRLYSQTKAKQAAEDEIRDYYMQG